MRHGSARRWMLDGIVWKRSDPWLTCFVDCSADGPGSLLGLAPGRTGACVRDWPGEQSEAFWNAIKIVVIDPSAPYASGIRSALPDAKIAADKWHLVALANQMVTEVRQRVTRDLLGRRGTVADPMWVNRRLLLTAAEHFSARQWARLNRMLDDYDPTNDIGAAWGVKERLWMLLAEHEPSRIRRRLADFYNAAIDAQLPETIQTWVAKSWSPLPKMLRTPARRASTGSVDGSPGPLCEMARHSALHVPESQLAPNAVVILHDADRPDNKASFDDGS